MIIWGPKTYGGAIGWDGAGPLALEQAGDVVFEQPVGPRINRALVRDYTVAVARTNRVAGPSPQLEFNQNLYFDVEIIPLEFRGWEV